MYIQFVSLLNQCRLKRRIQLLELVIFSLAVLLSGCSSFDPFALNAPQSPVRQPTYELLLKVHRLQEQQDADKALRLLNKFYPRVKRLPKDRALIHQARAYLWISQDNFKNAIPFLEQAIAGEHLGQSMTNGLRYKLAQIYLHEGRLVDGIRTLESWFEKTEHPSAQEHAVAGHAYYLAGQYGAAIFHLNAAILDPTPKDSWYAILLSAYLKTNSIHQAKEVVGALLKILPHQREYWLQLIAIETNLANEAHALASFELAQRVGVLNPSELIQIAKFNLQENLPHRAAELLENGLEQETISSVRENWQLLADAWILAREYERALGPLLKVRELSDVSTIYATDLQRSELYMRLQQWSNAQKLLESIPLQSGAKFASRVRLLHGISAYYSRDYDQSIRSFESAAQHPSTQEIAGSWLERTRWKIGSSAGP